VEPDVDADGYGDETQDALPADPSEHEDTDDDGIGNNADGDDDNDGISDDPDNCQTVANLSQADTDSDGAGDACDVDDDADGRPDAFDNCSVVANPDQSNLDGDPLGDACDPDNDNDGAADAGDNCPAVMNAEQANADGDGEGDACDLDDDNDGKPDTQDGCPKTVGTSATGCPALSSSIGPLPDLRDPPVPNAKFLNRVGTPAWVSTLADGELSVGARCSAACDVRVVAKIDARTAQRAGWRNSKKARRIGEAQEQLGLDRRESGPVQGSVDVSLSRITIRRLLRLPRFKMHLIAVPRAATGVVGAVDRTRLVFKLRKLSMARAYALANDVAETIHYDLLDTYGHGVDYCRRQSRRTANCRIHLDSLGLIRCEMTLRIYLRDDDTMTWRRHGEPSCFSRI
jgi:hypothetical protein